MSAAVEHPLAPKLTVRVVTGPHFLATKLEAFFGRGGGDLFASHDLEDVVYVIDGRPSITEEVRGQSAELRQYLAARFKRLLDTTEFEDALPGYLLPDMASQARAVTVFERMRDIAAAL